MVTGFCNINRLQASARVSSTGVRAGAGGARRAGGRAGRVHAGRQRVRLRRAAVPAAAAGAGAAGAARWAAVLPYCTIDIGTGC